ncbi:MAG TPA: Nif11-like leader peptide family natural product precursor [Herpetosiphonaceae bacterium]
MSHDRLDEFRDLVLHDPELQAQLQAIFDRRAFTERMVQLAAERGYRFTTAQIETALAEARRDWSRWRSVR